jgi:hypothetical protein
MWPTAESLYNRPYARPPKPRSVQDTNLPGWEAQDLLLRKATVNINPTWKATGWFCWFFEKGFHCVA